MISHNVDKHGLEKHGLEKHGLEKHGLEKHGLEKHGLEKHGLEQNSLEQHSVDSPLNRHSQHLDSAALPGRASEGASIDLYAQSLFNRLRDSAAQPDTQIIGITACDSGAGVSTIASALARAAALGQFEVLLIEANGRRPSLARRFQVAADAGLAEVLSGESAWQEAVQAPHDGSLHLLPFGKAMPTQQLGLASTAFAELTRQLREHFELIIVDLPAVEATEPTLPWTAHMDGVLLVLEADRVHEEDARAAHKALRGAQAQILGAVLNKRREHLPRWLHSRSP